MAEYTQELLDKIRKSFSDNLGGDIRAADLLRIIADGAGGYPEAGDYALKVGEALEDAFKSELSSAVLPDGKMDREAAEQIIRPMLEEDHRLVSDATERVQQALNDAAGIGIKPQTIPVNESRVEGFIERISKTEWFDDIAWILGEPVKNFSQSVVDDTLAENVEFQGRAGLSPSVVRRAESGACKWCRALVGRYSYPNVPEDVYHRHEYCRCIVEYNPGDGRRQDVWSKQWQEPEAVLQARREFTGLDTNPRQSS